MFWLVDEPTVVDTEELLRGADRLRVLCGHLQDAAGRMGTALDQLGCFTGAYGSSPALSNLAAEMQLLQGQLAALESRVSSHRQWRAMAAFIFADAEGKNSALFAACNLLDSETCGVQRWSVAAGLADFFPPLGNLVKAPLRAFSVFSGAALFTGRGRGVGTEAAFLQRTVNDTVTGGTFLVAGVPWLFFAKDGRPPLAQLASTAARSANFLGMRKQPGQMVLFTAGTRKVPAQYGVADAGGLVFQGPLPLPAPLLPGTAGSDLREAPQGAGALLEALRQPADQGMVELLRHDTESASGRVTTSWSVLIRGTKEWTLGADNPQDMLTNLQEVGGDPSDQRTAVLASMEMAGVQPDEPVELVGHSQGGIVAANLAADPNFTSQYAVASVLTAGSPVALAAKAAPKVRSLHLENLSDAVPAVDGKANPQRKGHVTVYFHPDLAPADASPHSVDTYQNAAAALDRGEAQSERVQQWLDERTKNLGITDATSTTSTRYWTRRAP